MKIQKFLTMLTVASIAMALIACDKDGNKENNSELSLESRAKALGFDDTATYVAFVRTNCTQEKHQNCNILANGEHRICDNVNHEGQHHNGEHHNGSKHENCGKSHRACCSDEENHHNGNHHGGNGH